MTGYTLAPLGLTLLLAARCSSSPSTDDSTSPSTDEALQVGLRHFAGLANVGAGYTGWEAFRFTGGQGLGEEVCTIRYSMDDEAVRMDCPDCLWAFDLVSSAPGIDEESGEGCTGLGLGLEEFDGLRASYGYAASSGAYQDVLMYQVGSYGWYPVSYATWEEPRFQYDWEMGLYYY